MEVEKLNQGVCKAMLQGPLCVWQLSQGPWKMVNIMRWYYKSKLALLEAKT